MLRTKLRPAPCANPLCQQGGLDVQHLLMMNGPGSYVIDCRGHEGSPNGRRKGDPCDNVFNVNVEIDRE
jgi:hypothetical protein